MIFGIICSLISPLLGSVQAVFTKTRLKAFNSINDAVLFARFFYVLPVLVIYAAIRWTTIPVINPWFITIILILVLLEVPAQFFYQQAIKSEKISLITPIGSLLTIPMMTSFIFFKGWSVVGCAGIIVITGGVYILQARTHMLTANGKLFDPIKLMWLNKGSRFMLWAVICWSITSPLQRVAIAMSNIEIMGICYLGGCSILTIVWGKQKGIPIRDIIFPNKIYLFAPIGLFGGVANILQYTALSLINPAYVVALKQTGQLWAIIWDRKIFQHRISSSQTFAICIIITGALLVGFGMI